jgi:hypothetical protein
MLPLLVLLLFRGNTFAEGVRAYEEGRFEDAYTAFSEAEAAAGNSASAQLLFNRALAALNARELRVAEFTAEKSAARGGPELVGLGNFLLGNAAFVRGELAEAEASLMDADPTSLARAILNMKNALKSWQLTAASRSDWPEARRNAERALIKLEDLEQKMAEADEQPPQTEQTPPPTPDEETEEVEEEPIAQEAPPELSPEQLARLLDKLAQLELEKRALREATQRARSVSVEKDW